MLLYYRKLILFLPIPLQSISTIKMIADVHFPLEMGLDLLNEVPVGESYRSEPSVR